MTVEVSIIDLCQSGHDISSFRAVGNRGRKWGRRREVITGELNISSVLMKIPYLVTMELKLPNKPIHGHEEM